MPLFSRSFIAFAKRHRCSTVFWAVSTPESGWELEPFDRILGGPSSGTIFLFLSPPVAAVIAVAAALLLLLLLLLVALLLA
jgi:hypothetical protein